MAGKLCDKIEAWKEVGIYSDLPAYINENLNAKFELRPYQDTAFRNFITYFERGKAPFRTLFHMATGSGKTLIMAGLILYLYKKGYRNFLFFVNLSNIVVKTKDNFLTKTSSKYLFGDSIVIDGKRVEIKETDNFQTADGDAINICFTTTQRLHSDMRAVKENGVSEYDFSDGKIVLISDEAHHLSAGTKSNTTEEKENARHWESTVENIFAANSENVLLEFTATCDLNNADIRAKYEEKIVFDYPLANFREDGYSKEIKTLRSDSDIFDRALQAVLLSQYRLKVFNDNRLNIKPVVLLKSRLIKDNIKNREDFIDGIVSLSGERIKEIFDRTQRQIPILKQARAYFEARDKSFETLACEIRDGFAREHCITAGDDEDVEKNQRFLNSLEDTDNPYRVVFAVDKLNEGWDVLNLFDIVRLYETRDSRDGKPGAGTVAEAQLIGRGARYCPFEIVGAGLKDKRKYDADASNELRICETLYYHCQNEPRYINELHTALKEIGLSADDTVNLDNKLKESFKTSATYLTENIYLNRKVKKGEESFYGLLKTFKAKPFEYDGVVGRGGEDVLFDGVSSDKSVVSRAFSYTIKDIVGLNYSTVNKAMRRFPVLAFDVLKKCFPRLKSTREFVESSEYMGDLVVCITSSAKPTVSVIYDACVETMKEFSYLLFSERDRYDGSKVFEPFKIKDVITDKTISCTPIAGGKGVSQYDFSVENSSRMDLSKEEWFVFEDNFGTSEEKGFVAYFAKKADLLKQKYDIVYLIRNERQCVLYSFDGGERFEPDFILFLKKGEKKKIVFIEPKGEQLLECDKWKEDFLLELKNQAVVSDGGCQIEGFHFFNREKRAVEFEKDMQSLLN